MDSEQGWLLIIIMVISYLGIAFLIFKLEAFLGSFEKGDWLLGAWYIVGAAIVIYFSI